MNNNYNLLLANYNTLSQQQSGKIYKQKLKFKQAVTRLILFKAAKQSCCDDTADMKKRISALEAQSSAQQQQIAGMDN